MATNSQIARLHAIVSRLGIDNSTYRAMLYNNYRALTCKDLSSAQIAKLCTCLESKQNGHQMLIDAARKRLIAAIGGWLRSIGQVDASYDLRYIKAIACKASEKQSFNLISLERLRSLYAAFCSKQVDLSMVESATISEIARQATHN